MRRHDFGKNPLPARAMGEDTFPFARAPKNAARSRPRALPTTHPPLCGSLVIAENEIILFQIRQVLLECGYTHFPCKTGK